MIEGLASHGVEIHMVISGGYQTFEEYKQLGFSGQKDGIHYNYTFFIIKSNIWLKRISRYFLAPYVAPFFNKRKLKGLCQKIKPDIVFVHPSLEPLELFLSTFKGVRSFLTMTELNEFNDVVVKQSKNIAQKRINYKRELLLTKHFLPSVDILLVMTKTLLKHYMSIGTNPLAKVFHLPMTVDLERFNALKHKNNDSLSGDYLAYCGSSSFHKDGVDVMIKSFAKVLDVFPELTLKIAAFWEWDGKKMMNLIKELKLEGNVEYLGALDRSEIPAFLKDARLLLLPRPQTRQADGGFPTKLGEYLATGNPVCATTVGEIPDYLTDGEAVFFAKPGSVESLADAIIMALKDSAKAQSVGANGRKVAEAHFSQDVQAGKLHAFLTECLITCQ